MISKDNIQRYLTYAIIIAVFLYAIIKSGKDAFMPIEAKETTSLVILVGKFLYDIWDIASLTISIILAYFFVSSPLLVKLILKEDFITGVYKGISFPHDDFYKPDGESDTEENFEVKQTLISTTITGNTYYRGVLKETIWEGTLFDKVGRTHRFVIQIHTEPLEYGILTIQFKTTGFYGKYNSANPGKNKAYFIKGAKNLKSRFKVGDT